MAFELVEIGTGDGRFSGMKSVSVTASLHSAVRTASLHVTEIGPWPNAPPWKFPPFTPMVITATGDLMLDGYVLEYKPEANPKAHEVSLDVVSRAYNYVSSSVYHQTHQFIQKTVLQIAQEMDVFGVGITVSGGAAGAAMEAIPYFQARLASTPWVEIMRLLQARGCTMRGLADGGIEICKSSEQKHAGGIIQGQNIETMSAVHSGAEIFSDYEACGQSDGTDKAADLQPYGTATDAMVPIFRFKQVIDNELTTRKLCNDRADREKNGAASFAVRAEITVRGWRDEGGTLWEPGSKAYVYAPYLQLDRDMTIDEVNFTQSESGTFSTLSLITPESGGGEAPEVIGAQTAAWWQHPSRPAGSPFPPVSQRRSYPKGKL